jgi:hypothetical protein
MRSSCADAAGVAHVADGHDSDNSSRIQSPQEIFYNTAKFFLHTEFI